MIVIRNAGKTYADGTEALRDISLVVPQGEFVFLVGPNGAGKSTLLKLLNKEENASSGSILSLGRDLAGLQGNQLSEYRRQIGSVFQDPRLVSSKTVRENVLLPAEADGKRDEVAEGRADMAQHLARVSRLSDRFPSELSGGQQQKVAIARALVNSPAVILADEPTGNLSPQATDEVTQVLEAISRRGITIIL